MDTKQMIEGSVIGKLNPDRIEAKVVLVRNDYEVRTKRTTVYSEYFSEQKGSTLEVADNEWRRQYFWNNTDLGDALDRMFHRKLTAALKRAFPDADLRWSRTAGCKCGCSPGWKLAGGTMLDGEGKPIGNFGVNVWVRFTYTPTDTTTEATTDAWEGMEGMAGALE